MPRSPLKIDQNSEFSSLLKLAKKALLNAYSPYSKVKVGAAVLTASGRIYSGCNVENASYGGTICAERNAIATAVATGDLNSDKKKISAILIATNQKKIWPPCGLCRQVLAEFCSPATRVYCVNAKSDVMQTAFEDIFPCAFDSTML